MSPRKLIEANLQKGVKCYKIQYSGFFEWMRGHKGVTRFYALINKSDVNQLCQGRLGVELPVICYSIESRSQVVGG